MTTPDTTTGGGSDYDGSENDPDYRAPTESGPAATNAETTVPTSTGDTGDTDDHTRDPRLTPPDTTVPGGEAGGIGDTGDTDDHSRDPHTTPPDTTTGGGGDYDGSDNDPDYRAPGADAPVTTKDTTTQGGQTGGAVPGSPNEEAVGGGATNPNAAEPGLTNTAYDVGGTKDTSYIGAGLTTVPSASGTPDAPEDVEATLVEGRNALVVSWTPPSNASATGVTSYIVQSNTGGTETAGKNATEVEFEQGLVPGHEYTFTVYAVTANGTGERSDASDSVLIPMHGNIEADDTVAEGVQGPTAEVPGTTATPVATATNSGTVSVAFVAPTDNGGSPVTEYTVVSTPGGVTKVGASSPLVVTGLTVGQAYTFKVKARNAYGYGDLSAASNSVTAHTVPGAPTIGAASVASATSASVAFTAPVSNGGSAITSYTVTSTPGGLTASGANSPLVVNGLTTGVAYTFKAKATNAQGVGAESAASNSVTPA